MRTTVVRTCLHLGPVLWTALIWPSGAVRAQSGEAPGRPVRLGNEVEVDDVRVEADARSGDARGVAIHFRYRVGRVNTEKALFLTAYFNSESGGPVAARVSDKGVSDRDGWLHGKVQLITVPRGTWRTSSMFVPFVALGLAPGSHLLKAPLRAVSDAGSCQAGERPPPVRVVGVQEVSFRVAKPPVRQVQLRVLQTTVPERSTDLVLWPRHKARPDLQWRVELRGSGLSPLFVSPTRADRYRARWDGPSSPFLWSEGDRITLSLWDEDPLKDDLLAEASLAFEEALQLGERSPVAIRKSGVQFFLGPLIVLDPTP